MSKHHAIIMLGCTADPTLYRFIHQDFDTYDAKASIDCLQALDAGEHKLVLIDISVVTQVIAFDLCRNIRARSDVPVILVTAEESKVERLQSYDCGADDYLALEHLSAELNTRLERLIINKIANDQLKDQLAQANEMAFVAMTDTSDLGVNIHFMLDANNCGNLDELGMCLFQALKNYGLNCSLQMRSGYDQKDMEANGMAKALESRLLYEMRGEGRYVDFSHRSIMNYNRVSLLVKNMPIDNERKYGAIKDNVFSLLQGVDARIQALDNLRALQTEKQLVHDMVEDMKAVMASVDEKYQVVMRDIASVVEEMADGIEHSIQFLGMDEHQERALQRMIVKGINATTEIFAQGLELDEGLQGFLRNVASEESLAPPSMSPEATPLKPQRASK